MLTKTLKSSAVLKHKPRWFSVGMAFSAYPCSKLPSNPPGMGPVAVKTVDLCLFYVEFMLSYLKLMAMASAKTISTLEFYLSMGPVLPLRRQLSLHPDPS
jgi:hypothetical protein